MPRKANPYLRVTEVCSFINAEWYKYWAKSVGVEECERVSKESREFGTAVHKVIENYLIQTPIPAETTERQLFCGKLITDWCIQSKFKPLLVGDKPAVEITLTSEEYGYRGHPDAVGTFGDSKIPWVLDWKTSKECRLEYILQMSAYANAMKEEHGIIVDDGAVLRAPSDPTVFPQFKPHEFHNLNRVFFPVFLQGLEICQFFKKRGKWKEVFQGLDLK